MRFVPYPVRMQRVIRPQPTDRVRRAQGAPQLVPLRLRFMSFALHEPTQAICYPRHQHASFELILVESGSYRAEVNDDPVTLHADKVLIVQPGDWHEDSCESPTRYFAIQASLTRGGKSIPVFNKKVQGSQQVVRTDVSQIRLLFERLRQEQQRGDGLAAMVQDALFGEFFWRLIRSLPEDQLAPQLLRASRQQSFIDQLQSLFHEHLDSPLPVGKMAGALSICERSLTKHCQKLLGASPAKAFQAYKMEHARLLLSETDNSVKTISNMLGFSNPFHFTRVFKQHHGVPPTDFRQM